ncbi:MAG: MBL fold metallo-hydrolase [Methanosarcinaceae archaeon]|nr:MBL fold metallo-hydrolase [Methanosarcinaceae archaeon]MDD4749363.1 MBL fold metallo-hydrolase [Methanosarcinaceae archaeon]
MLKLTILYDNEAEPGFKGSWGFSALLETEKDSLLFDTGWDGGLLLEHMEKLGISPLSFKKLVLSHQHWDHVGGLPDLLRANPNLTVYLPESFSKNMKVEIQKRAKLVEISRPCKILPGIYSSGELGTKIKEQSLFLNSGKGIYVLTGCAHPGLSAILDAAKNFGKVRGLIGGLHSSTEFEKLKGLKLVAAGHCSTHKAEIQKRFPSSFLNIGAGLQIELE